MQSVSHKEPQRCGRIGTPGFQLGGLRELLRVLTDVTGTAVVGILLLASAFHADAALAADDSARQSRIVDGITVYLGLIPAEILKGHPTGHIEREMHGPSAAGAQGYHVLIALFDSASGARITDVTVQAAISETGLPGTRVVLEPMTIADTVTFGNFVSLPAGVPYRIKVWIRRPGIAREILVEFAQQPLLP